MTQVVHAPEASTADEESPAEAEVETDTEPDGSFSEKDRFSYWLQTTMESIGSDTSSRVAIYAVRRKVSEDDWKKNFEDWMRDLEQDGTIKLEPHPKPFKVMDRRRTGSIKDPERGLIYYVTWTGPQ